MAMHEWNMIQQKAMTENFTIAYDHPGYVRRVFSMSDSRTWYREYHLWRNPRFDSGEHALFNVMATDHDADHEIIRNSWENRGTILARIPIEPKHLTLEDIVDARPIDILEVLLELAIRNLDPDFFTRHPKAKYQPGESDSQKPNSPLDEAQKEVSPEALQVAADMQISSKLDEMNERMDSLISQADNLSIIVIKLRQVEGAARHAVQETVISGTFCRACAQAVDGCIKDGESICPSAPLHAALRNLKGTER